MWAKEPNMSRFLHIDAFLLVAVGYVQTQKCYVSEKLRDFLTRRQRFILGAQQRNTMAINCLK